MPQEWSQVAYNRMLDALDDTETLYISAHTGDPGVDGQTGNEVTGGTPAYARKAGTWSAASGAQMTLSGTVTLDIPSGATVTYLGLWDSLAATAAANFMGRVSISPEAFGSQGTLDVTAFTLALDQNPA
jgi:hypothetical protein